MTNVSKVKIKIEWPDIEIPPVNLWVVMPVDFFYANEQQRKEYLEKCLNL